MDPLEWILQFIDQISAPAKVMTGSVRALTKSILELQTASDKLRLPALTGSSGGGRGGGRNSGLSGDAYLKQQMQLFRKQQQAAHEYERFWQKSLAAQDKGNRLSSGLASMWGKIGQRMQRDQVAALKNAEPGVSKAFANMWQRLGLKMVADQTKAMKQAAAAAQREAEKASHKAVYGGHKSFIGLLTARAEHKTKGLATGAADWILSAPGRAIGGAGSLIGGAASAAVALAEGTANAAINLGKAAINAQAIREDSVSGLTAVFGSAEEANRLFDAARTAAKQTKFDTQDVVRDFNTIAAAGFKAHQIERIYWTSADIGSARGEGRQQRYLNALAKLNANPQAAFGAVQQAALAGPGLGNVYDALKQRLNITKDLSRKEWMKLFASGKVSGSEALEAVIDATNKLYNKTTGLPGEYAKALGDKSWSGTISNIKNGLGDILNLRLDEDHPINKFKKILQAIGSSGGLFDNTTVRGRRFESLIRNLVSDIFSIFGGLSDNVGDTMDNLLTLMEKLRGKFHEATEYIRTEIVPAITNGINSPALEDHLVSFAAKIAAIIAKGIYVGITNALGWERYSSVATGSSWQAWKNLGHDLIMGKPKEMAASGTSSEPMPSGPMSVDTSELPSFDKPGTVPGPYGKPRLAIVHGGEEWPGLGRSTKSKDGGSPPINLTMPIQIHGNLSMDESDILRAIEQGGASLALKLQEIIASAQGVQPN